jgi:hypothetical protein
MRNNWYTRFFVIFGVTFVVNVAAIFVLNLIDGNGSVDVVRSVIVALLVATVLTLLVRR